MPRRRPQVAGLTMDSRMRHFSRRTSKPGTPPGTLQAPAERRVDKVTITVFNYGPEHLVEKELSSVEEVATFKDAPGVTWINVVGVHDVDALQSFGDRFGLHPLALEDVVNTGQRPKFEDYEGCHFIVMRLIHLGETVEGEQISFFLGKGWVLTFQEIPGDVFDPVRDRIRKGRPRIRKAGADYLVYALIDALVDSFFPILEKLGERIEDLEDELIDNPATGTLEKIHQTKRELLQLRRAAWPQREVIHALERQESDLVKKETRVFLRDCYDHTIQIMDVVETYRDLAGGMMDLYLSSVSNRMNEVMKVLTVMASIFIPLTFLAGIYGMNFNPEASPWNMPELDWRWGYPVFWLVMLGVGGAMVWYFKRKDWL